MRVMTATEVKNKLGDTLSFPDDDSLLIEKNGKAAFMAFSVQTAKKMILTSYVHGGISRSETMKLMGFDWYGQLLDALATAKMKKPTLPENERTVMTAYASKILGSKCHGKKTDKSRSLLLMLAR